MKKIAALLLGALLASGAFAQTTNQATSTVDTTSHADNAGNKQEITFTSPGESRTTVKNVPSMGVAGLTSSNDTCMGSVSGGVSVVGVGVSGGVTYESVSCVMLKESRELWNMGMRAAALARMCAVPSMKEALELTGFECPQTTRDKNKLKPVDPIVVGTKPKDE